MSQSTRQSELFTAQNWTVIYKAFTSINFNASDPPSINNAMRDYIKLNYAEDYTDWIESSEFSMIIDLLSWLAGNLAYKTDISARENFLETAEARESVLRLARFLSYSPKRNQPARGLLKITSIRTNDIVYDAFGNNLQNKNIIWNDSNNADWFEQFVIILNSVFSDSSQFGNPINSGSSSNIATQLYQMDSAFGDSSLSFSVSANGTTMPCEIINVNYDSVLGFIERSPNAVTGMNMIYQNDGYGNGSQNTGFFLPFKQGTLGSQVFSIANPSENLVLPINVDNINQSDVWVQTIDDSGNVLIDWDKVPAIFAENVTYNSISSTIRNIFQVITRDSDQISIRFADGRFGTAPSGNIRVIYRVSAGTMYQIQPVDASNISVTLVYKNFNGNSRNLTLNLSLQSTVANAAAAETVESIKLRAPQIYSAQNRMVTGNDYSVFPLSSNLAIKIKALNRIYSGQSRFIDLNDPTGNYQNVVMFGDDGLFYQERDDYYAEVSNTENKSSSELIDTYISQTLINSQTANYVYDYLLRNIQSGNIVAPIGLNAMVWTNVTKGSFSSTGYFNVGLNWLKTGVTMLFTYPDGITQKWSTVINLVGTGTIAPMSNTKGPVTLSANIPSGSVVTKIIPAYSPNLTSDIVANIQNNINNKVSFSLWYDYNTDNGTTPWKIYSSVDYYSNGINAFNSTSLLIMNVSYLSGSVWRFTAPGLRYIFESVKSTQFYFDGSTVVDKSTGQVASDIIKILSINQDFNGGVSLSKDYSLKINSMITYPNGYKDNSRVVVEFLDSDLDGTADDPDTFYKVVNPENYNSYLFWQYVDYGQWTPINTVNVYATEGDRTSDINRVVGDIGFQIESTNYPNTFWVYGSSGWTLDYTNYRYAIGRGSNLAGTWTNIGDIYFSPSPIKFQWTHVAPDNHRIDPSRSNIIDVYVLLSEYDYVVRSWIQAGANQNQIPTAPTEFDLRMSFSDMENYKTFSDDIVWKPVKYKFLFGQTADPELRCQFKIILLPNAPLSEGEIKAKILQSINDYFAPTLWDMGEGFYATELITYVHQQLVGNISSFVIVPEASDGVFGQNFEIACNPDELFISTAQISDIITISSNTATNLKIR